MPNLVETIKKAAIDAVKASKPCDIAFGKVISIDPLQVMIDQKIVLAGAMLVVTANCVETMRGDTVVLIRTSGGQTYVLIDKVVVS